MKFRNVLMTAAFVLAVGSTFAIKAKRPPNGYLSYILGGKCYVAHAETNPLYCDVTYTGAQCTYLAGLPAYFQEINGWPPPTCTIPLRRP